MKNRVFILLTLMLSGCMKLTPGVEETLMYAGENRGELKKVLRHYSWHKKDSLKYRAACFLIENMKWHFVFYTVKDIDPQFKTFCEKVDSAYFSIYEEKGGKLDSLEECYKDLKTRYKRLADTIKKHDFIPSKTSSGLVGDPELMSSEFLIGHIDNAFKQWETSVCAKKLNFDEFCEYILPYRSVSGYPFLYSGRDFNCIYGKYVNYEREGRLAYLVKRYNRTVINMRNFLGERPEKDIGIYNLFFHGHECLDVATYGCNVLRSCGVPVMIEFCDAYRDFAGRHYYCVALDSHKVWKTFNPESSLPDNEEWVIGTSMNLYRQYYGAQKEAAYFNRNEGEYLPVLFRNPCLREITGERLEVFRVTLPFKKKTANKLAYLAAFQAKREMAPVTWAKIDKDKEEITFKNTLPDRLYFPVYYDERVLTAFGAPFYVEKDSTSDRGYRIHYFDNGSDSLEDIIITRKFPRKPSMIQVAENLIGSTFKGANQRDFSDAKVIYTITRPPMPYLQDFVIKNPGAYRFYRFTAPEHSPHANVAMLEFLTDKKYDYKNVWPPTPRAILRPCDTTDLSDVKMVKLLDAPSWDQMKWKAEYDGNMQTAPSAYKIVHFNLKEPQIVERIRFAPRNADNGIKRGERYELLCWKNKWVSCGIQTAKYEFLEFSGVPRNAILWLINHTSGKEELPFVMREGKQLFLYYDIAR